MKKLGRDVTFESKHVIFLLQRCANSRYVQFLLYMCLHISHFSKIKSLIASVSDSQKNENFAEADERIKFIDDCKFKEIAREVCGLNGELYARSYDWGVSQSPTIISYHNLVLVISVQYFIAGVEEYVEALTFLTFLREGRLLTLEEIQKKLCFRVTPSSSDAPVSRSFGFYAVGNFIHLFAGFA